MTRDNRELFKDACKDRVDLDGRAILALIADLEAAEALLREAEWNGCAEDYDTEAGAVYSRGGCPICNGFRHETDCRLAALLRALGTPEGGK